MNPAELERQLRSESQGGGDGHQAAEERPPQSTASKPKVNELALYGLAGNAVRTIDAYTEADPVAVLITFLSSFGSVIGRKAHFTVEYTPHYLNLFSVLVGESSKGRKGVSKSTPE